MKIDEFKAADKFDKNIYLELKQLTVQLSLLNWMN